MWNAPESNSLTTLFEFFLSQKRFSLAKRGESFKCLGLCLEQQGAKRAGVMRIMVGKKPAFGGYSISFAGRKETAEEIFGKGPIAPSAMTKKIWEFVKSKNLSNKKA